MTGTFSIEHTAAFFAEANIKPEISLLPMMFRRRLSPLGKAAFSTFEDLSQKTALSGVPAVFVSRFAEMKMSLEMIQAMQEDQLVSPAKFSISVHNSLAGQFSIFYKNQQSIKALSAGPYSLANGLIELLTLANSSVSKVLLNASDDPHPEIYEKYADYPMTQSSMSFIFDVTKSAISWEIEYGETATDGKWREFYTFANSDDAPTDCYLPLSENSVLHLWR